MFLDNLNYWIDDSGPDRQGEYQLRGSGIKKVSKPPDYITPEMGEDLVLYLPKLKRDGWHLVDHTNDGKNIFDSTDRWKFEKPICESWTLRKWFTASLVNKSPSGATYWETHELIGPEGVQKLEDCWAGTYNGEVIFAREGCLWRMKCGNDARQVADLNSNKFSVVRAPYEGVDTSDKNSQRIWPSFGGKKQ